MCNEPIRNWGMGTTCLKLGCPLQLHAHTPPAAWQDCRGPAECGLGGAGCRAPASRATVGVVASGERGGRRRQRRARQAASRRDWKRRIGDVATAVRWFVGLGSASGRACHLLLGFNFFSSSPSPNLRLNKNLTWASYPRLKKKRWASYPLSMSTSGNCLYTASLIWRVCCSLAT